MLSENKKLIKKEIKIVVSGGMGDCLLATPFIRHFKQIKKYDNIILASPKGFIEIFDRNPYIDQLIPCSGQELFFWAAPEKDCDIFSPYINVSTPNKIGAKMNIPVSNIFKANLNDQPLVHQVAEHHGIRLMDETPEIYLSDEDECWADEYMNNRFEKPLILLNPSSNFPIKNIPFTLSKEIVRQLENEFSFIQLEDGKTPIPGTHVVSPVPNIRQSAALFKKLFCVITCDSFPGHLARAVNTPAVVLFGPSNPKAFGHKENKNIRTSRCPVCADTDRRTECKKPVCMEEITVDPVVECVFSIKRHRFKRRS